jgi:tetratricopeptide (TPR) repeat protein
MGRAFFETGAFDQATDVLREALEGYELTDDTSKELMYRLGIAHQSAGRLQEAKEVFGKLMRIDYNYANGDVRRRVDELNKGG